MACKAYHCYVGLVRRHAPQQLYNLKSLAKIILLFGSPFFYISSCGSAVFAKKDSHGYLLHSCIYNDIGVAWEQCTEKKKNTYRGEQWGCHFFIYCYMILQNLCNTTQNLPIPIYCERKQKIKRGRPGNEANSKCVKYWIPYMESQSLRLWLWNMTPFI